MERKKKYKKSDVIRCIEYAGMDCYGYVIREKKTNKVICTWRSEEECEKEFEKINVLSSTK